MKIQPLYKSMFLIAFGVILTWALMNYEMVLKVLSTVGTILSPFLTGMAIAFMLNILMSALERLALRSRKIATSKVRKAVRPLCLLISIIVVFGVIIALLFLILPQISHSLIMVAEQFPAYFTEVQAWVVNLAANYEIDLSQYVVDWVAVSNTVANFLQQYGSDMIDSTINFTTSLIGSFINLFFAFVFSIYILLQKETLGRQFSRLIHAIVPQKIADGFTHHCLNAALIFKKFVTGQMTEAIILGTLCFCGMSLFQFPYALMISALIGFTALLPIIGAFIGTVIGAFLILMISPIQAFWFLVFLLILQQLEGNLIYPRVMGKSVGLPGIWVLFSVTVGGSIGGIVGMLLAVPTCSFVYGLLRDFVHKRLDKSPS